MKHSTDVNDVSRLYFVSYLPNCRLTSPRTTDNRIRQPTELFDGVWPTECVFE